MYIIIQAMYIIIQAMYARHSPLRGQRAGGPTGNRATQVPGGARGKSHHLASEKILVLCYLSHLICTSTFWRLLVGHV